MDDPKEIILRLPKTPNEVWVAGKTDAELTGALKALGEYYNLDVWFNGEKVHEAVKEYAEPKPAS